MDLQGIPKEDALLLAGNPQKVVFNGVSVFSFSKCHFNIVMCTYRFVCIYINIYFSKYMYGHLCINMHFINLASLQRRILCAAH